MRFIITLITSLILLIPASGQGQWERVDLGIDSTFFPGLYDGGWLKPYRFSDVQFINRNIGFLVGDIPTNHGGFGILYKTEDGGKTWNIIYQDGPVFTSIHFVNESIGFNLHHGTLKITQDGGNSWTEDNTIYFYYETGMLFLNDSTGWVWAGSSIFKTINGCSDWYEIDRNVFGGSYLRSQINSLFLIDDSTSWAVGIYEHEIERLPNHFIDKGLITKYTLNDGWKVLPLVTDLPLNKVFFVDRDNGWISGGYSSSDDINPIFLRTVDGGENWTKNTEMNYLINDFYFENKDHGWAVGEANKERGVILETFNGGLDWDVVVDSLPGKLNALHFKDGVGWAVGDSGLIMKYDPTAAGIKEENKTNSGNEPIFQNYPNPFQSTTIISYQLTSASNVELSVYDISGRKVATLVNERQLPDRYEVEWNAEGMEAGIYFCELKGRQERQVMKMILID